MVKNPKISKNLKKNHFKKNYLFEEEEKIRRRKKCYPLSFPILGGRDLTRALQSSPFQNPGGGPLSVTDGGQRTKDEGRKSSCLILDSG